MGRWFCRGVRLHRWQPFTEWFPSFMAPRVEWVKAGERCLDCQREQRVVTIHIGERVSWRGETEALPQSLRGIDPDYTAGLDVSTYVKKRWAGDA